MQLLVIESILRALKARVTENFTRRKWVSFSVRLSIHKVNYAHLIFFVKESQKSF